MLKLFKGDVDYLDLEANVAVFSKIYSHNGRMQLYSNSIELAEVTDAFIRPHTNFEVHLQDVPLGRRLTLKSLIFEIDARNISVRDLVVFSGDVIFGGYFISSDDALEKSFSHFARYLTVWAEQDELRLMRTYEDYQDKKRFLLGSHLFRDYFDILMQRSEEEDSVRFAHAEKYLYQFVEDSPFLPYVRKLCDLLRPPHKASPEVIKAYERLLNAAHAERYEQAAEILEKIRI